MTPGIGNLFPSFFLISYTFREDVCRVSNLFLQQAGVHSSKRCLIKTEKDQQSKYVKYTVECKIFHVSKCLSVRIFRSLFLSVLGRWFPYRLIVVIVYFLFAVTLGVQIRQSRDRSESTQVGGFSQTRSLTNKCPDSFTRRSGSIVFVGLSLSE